MPSFNILEEEYKNSSLVICADGGANVLYKYKDVLYKYKEVLYKSNDDLGEDNVICKNNEVTHILMGDFDSINKDVYEFFLKNNTTIIQYPKEKDYTDSFLALDKAIEYKPDEIVILGATGTRLDHTMGNMGLLLKCLKTGVKAYIKDNNNVIMLCSKNSIIKKENKKYFSLLAYGESVENLTIKGAKYELVNYNLELGQSICVSNEFKEDEINISFDSGLILVILSKD